VSPDGTVVSVGNVDATYLGAPAPTLFVVKNAQSDGSLIWSRQQGERKSTYSAVSVSVDREGMIYTGGTKFDALGSVDLRSGPLLTAWTPGGTEAVFLRVIGVNTAASGVFNGVAVDWLGAVHLAGNLNGTFCFGGQQYTGAGNGNGFGAILGPVRQPPLTIAPSSNNTVRVSWPATATGYRLEQTGSLPSTNWTPVPGIIGSTSNIPLAAEPNFLRLEAAP
jgi:hypothetical protein